MKLVGLLVWADEKPQWLFDCIEAIAPLLDHLVAVDGKYALYPGSDEWPVSHPDETSAVVDACLSYDLPFTLHRPQQAFEQNEVGKRNFSLDLAHNVCDEGDWLLSFDADMIARPMSVETIRNKLATTKFLSAEYGRYGGYHDAEEFAAFRGFYRFEPSLRYGPTHFSLSYGKQTWLWGGPYHTDNQPTLDMTSLLAFDHLNHQRHQARKDSARDYYQERDTKGIER